MTKKEEQRLVVDHQPSCKIFIGYFVDIFLRHEQQFFFYLIFWYIPLNNDSKGLVLLIGITVVLLELKKKNRDILKISILDVIKKITLNQVKFYAIKLADSILFYLFVCRLYDRYSKFRKVSVVSNFYCLRIYVLHKKRADYMPFNAIIIFFRINCIDCC